MNQWLGRGISFGNALDAPGQHEWEFRRGERYFTEVALLERHVDDVQQAGFDTVRLPVKWSAHAGEAPPYTIDPAFFQRVDQAVDDALERDLNVVVNTHHYDQLCAAPERHEARFLALWRQVGQRYAGHPPRLCFELLNEPHDPMTPQQWNALLPKALAVVRESNPTRSVVVGPVWRNDVGALGLLELPDDDNLVVTVHYYAPLAFTHQGAAWLAGADRWLGTTWGGDADQGAVRRDLTEAAAWAEARGRPLFLGEFGVYEKAEMAARVRWTAFVRSEAERLGMSWAYWDFGSDFGAFDLRRNAWREPLRRALLAR